jgi:hypothetical protein
VGDDVESFDALMPSEDCGDLLDRIGLALEDVGCSAPFDTLGYVLAVGYCGVKDDDFPWLVALDATNQGKNFFLVGVKLS